MFALAASKLLAVSKTMAMMAGLSGLAVIGPLAPPQLASTDMRLVKMADGGTIAVSRYEVTWSEWQHCAADGVCAELTLPAKLKGKADFPVTGVNALDVQQYIGWINARTGHTYRLPTADEWRIMAIDLPRKATRKLFDDPRMAWAADYGSMERVSGVVRASGHFGTFANGISDLGGNVWEWTSTCAAADADAATCPAYVVEGLHEAVLPIFVRDPASGGCAVGAPPANVGFRLVRDDEARLTPQRSVSRSRTRPSSGTYQAQANSPDLPS